MSEVAGLAREIGFAGKIIEAPGVIGLFAADLLNQLAANVSTGSHHAKYIEALGSQLFTRIGLDDDRQALVLAGTALSDLVDSIDCDDGWPQCPRLNAIKACALALECGLGSDNSRWPAEAANTVGALVLGLVEWNAETRDQRHDFARGALRRAVYRFEGRESLDEHYEIGKRDGYEEAVQDIDLATGGDGEFKGSTLPGGTVDVPAMRDRIAAVRATWLGLTGQ